MVLLAVQMAHGSDYVRGTPYSNKWTPTLCRDWCEKKQGCYAVDFRGVDKQCLWHKTKTFKTMPATSKDSGTCSYKTVGQYKKKKECWGGGGGGGRLKTVLLSWLVWSTTMASNFAHCGPIAWKPSAKNYFFYEENTFSAPCPIYI
jgi:hypothetical protein